MNSRFFSLSLVALLSVAMFSTARVCPAQHDRDARQEELSKILHGLEAGIDALRKLGRDDEVRHMLRIFRNVQREAEAHGRERAHARRRLEVMDMAKGIFRKTKRQEMVARVEHAMHALKVRLANRRDQEARRILEREPAMSEQVKLLTAAAKLFRQAEALDQARAVAGLAEQLAKQQRRRHDHEGREGIEHRLELMAIATKVLAAADETNEARRLRHAMMALKFSLDDRRDAEAMRVRRDPPSRREQAKLLVQAAKILDRRGKDEKAGAVLRLAESLQGNRRRERKQRGRLRRRRHDDDDDDEEEEEEEEEEEDDEDDDDDHDDDDEDDDDDDDYDDEEEEEEREIRRLRKAVETVEKLEERVEKLQRQMRKMQRELQRLRRRDR